MSKIGCTYILSNRKNGTLYIGVTSNLEKRIREHKNKTHEGFTKKYNVNMLVWYNEFPTIQEAIEFEKKLKAGNRKSKISLIEENNIEWLDLISNF